VVKDVTGYDLCKLMAGSWGTLAAMTDVTIKTLPQAEIEQTILVVGGDAAAAGKNMASAIGSYGDISARGQLPGAIAPDVAGTASARSAVTVLRLEGVAPSVAQRKSLLENMLAPFGALASLEGASSRTLWRAIRDVTPFAAKGRRAGADIWRISTAPARGA